MSEGPSRQYGYHKLLLNFTDAPQNSEQKNRTESKDEPINFNFLVTRASSELVLLVGCSFRKDMHSTAEKRREIASITSPV
jgi:hypothetical protein